MSLTMLLLLPMLLIIASNVIYHWSQKTIPHVVNPAASMLVSYGVAIMITLALLPLFGRPERVVDAFRTLNWSSVLVGVSIVGVELGFLMAYRNGWQLNLAAITSSAALAILLVVIGWGIFHEGWSIKQSSGVVLCLLGLYLIN